MKRLREGIKNDCETPSPEKNESLPTETMLGRLKAASGLDDFITVHQKDFLSNSVCEHFDMLLEKYGVGKAEAIERSNIECGYAYQILRGIRNAKRDKYIRLAIGIGLDLEDTQRLLTVVRHGVLYPKVLRDAVIIYAVNNRLSIVDLECLMEEKKVDLLE